MYVEKADMKLHVGNHHWNQELFHIQCDLKVIYDIYDINHVDILASSCTLYIKRLSSINGGNYKLVVQKLTSVNTHHLPNF